MEECSEAEVSRLLPLVNAQRREQALRYKHVFGQFCCLRSWLMLADLLREESGKRQVNVSVTLRDFSYNEHGKPILDGGPYFSISHCKEAIAVAISEEPIGIDIEAIRHADDSLIERTMNEPERKMIRASEDRDRAFTHLWTQKEAVIKCVGTGIESFEQLQNLPLSEFRIQTTETEKYIYSIAYG